MVLIGVWAFATFAIAAAGGLFRGRAPTEDLPQTRHPRTQIGDDGGA